MLTHCKIDYSWEAYLAAEHPYISERSEGVCEKSVKIRTVIIRYSLSYVGKSYLSFDCKYIYLIYKTAKDSTFSCSRLLSLFVDN